MGALNALRKLLVDDVIIPPVREHGKNSCILSENESDYKFALRFLPDDALIIKCDKFPTTKDIFFRSDNMECKRSDFVLVSESEKVIMFFELKRSKSSAAPKEIVAQLKGAKCVMDYCESIANSFLGECSIFNGFTCKYYKGTYKSSQKRPFSRLEKPNNETPETARILPGSSASFAWL